MNVASDIDIGREGGREGGFRGHVTFAGSILQSRLKTLFLPKITSNLNVVQPTTKIDMNEY